MLKKRTSKSGAASHRTESLGYDLEAVRARFPALAIADDGRPRVYFDNPAGTQVPDTVVERMAECLLNANANIGGYFETSKRAGQIDTDAHAAMADFLNAESGDEIVFGQNMTTITLHLSRSIGKLFAPGDEIIVSRMCHDANIWPWVMMARDLDLEVRWLPFDPETFEFEADALENVLTDRSRLLCIGGASNLTGTINDVAGLCEQAKEAGVLTYVDAVQSAPHVSTDVQALGCDFLVCSAYKFFGPHQGVLWGRRQLLESLEPYKVRPAPDTLPWRFETGTQSHEGMAGTTAAVDYFAWIGETMAAEYHDQYPAFDGRRKYVHAAMDCLFDYEKGLAECLIDGLQSRDGIRVHGITSADAMDRRVPTVAFTHASKTPDEIASALAERNIFVWSGHNYALEVARSLGILEQGGAVRIGPVHYNDINEISDLLRALDDIIG